MIDKYPEFKAGIYRHYKGPLYLVLGLAHDANQEDRTAIVYIGLELDQAHTGPRFAIRTYDDFYSSIDPTSGNTVDSKFPGAILRFTFISNTFENDSRN
jgi:hypothetical protein